MANWKIIFIWGVWIFSIIQVIVIASTRQYKEPEYPDMSKVTGHSSQRNISEEMDEFLSRPRIR